MAEQTPYAKALWQEGARHTVGLKETSVAGAGGRGCLRQLKPDPRTHGLLDTEWTFSQGQWRAKDGVFKFVVQKDQDTQCS